MFSRRSRGILAGGRRRTWRETRSCRMSKEPASSLLVRLAPQGPVEMVGLAEQSFLGLDARRREELKHHLKLVCLQAELGLTDEGDEERRVEQSARIVHDLLEQALVATRLMILPRWMGWKRMARVGRVAALVLVFGGILVLGLREWSSHRSRARGLSQDAASASGRTVDARLADLAAPKAQGTPWDAPGTIRIPPRAGALVVRLEHRSSATGIEISLDNNDRYRIDFEDGTSVVGRVFVGPTSEPGGLIVYRRKVPGAAAERGFDHIRITPIEGDGAYAVGHLTLDPSPGGALVTHGDSRGKASP